MQQVQLIAWILAGFVLARTVKQVRGQHVDAVRKFAFAFLTPTLFFGAMSRADLEVLPSWQMVGGYLVSIMLLFFVVRLFLSQSQVQSVAESNVKSISALYPNAVGVGVPLIFSLYGNEAELMLMGIVFVNLVLILPAFNVLMIRSGEEGFYSYSKVATDPILLAIVGGALINLFGISLPAWLASSIDGIGFIALPIILVVLGASLGFYRTDDLKQQKVSMLLFVKVVGFPFAALIVAQYLFSLSAIETQVLVLLCALPTGINVYLLAERYQVARESTASVILGSTTCSLVSLIGWEMVVSRLA